MAWGKIRTTFTTSAGRACRPASLIPPDRLADVPLMWIAPTERDTAATTLETRFWHSAAPFRLNSGLKAREHSGPILRIIFLRFAEA